MPPSAIRTTATATSTRRSQRRRGSGLDIAGNGNHRAEAGRLPAREDGGVQSGSQSSNPPSRGDLIVALRGIPAAAALLERGAALTAVHIVGGAVRDLLRGHEPQDLDLVVEGDAVALAAQLGESIKAHERFGTATFRLGGFSYDIASSRRERYPQPGALPLIEPAGLQEDLKRRDFTVNAMALALDDAELGRLRFFPGALEDLAAGRLRILHPRSFLDDPTRLLRIARYGARLGMVADPQTRELVSQALVADALDSVSGERVGAELRLLAAEADPVSALVELRSLGIDEAIAPGFGLVDTGLARRALALLADGGGRADLLALAVAGSGLAAGDLARLLERLGFERQERDLVVSAATRSEAVGRALAGAERPSQIAAAVRGHEPEVVALAGAHGGEEQAHRWLTELRHVGLEIDGDALLSAGMREGPEVGQALRVALEARLDGLAPDREAQLREALRHAGLAG